MGKSKAPPAPDYAAAAREQGAANLQAGQQTAALNRPTQIDDNGSQEWSLKPGADPKNPNPGDWIVTTKLNDTQKALKDQQDQLSSQFGGLAKDSLSTIGDTMKSKFDISGLPKAQSLSNEHLTQFTGAPVAEKLGMVSAMSEADYRKAPEAAQNQFVEGSTEASRQRITDALYQRQMGLMQPGMKQEDSDMEARLAAQGITAGSAAYEREIGNMERRQGEQLANARNDAILAGGAEDSRIGQLNMGLTGFNNGVRDTRFGQDLQRAGFDNNIKDTLFGQQVTATQANNEAKKAMYDQAMTRATYGNSVRAQEFQERQAMSGVNNTLHNNAVQEALMLRQLPMNEANALRTGNQVGGVNFQGYGGAGQISAAPIYQAAGDQYSAAIDATNIKNANTASIYKGLAGVGSFMMG